MFIFTFLFFLLHCVLFSTFLVPFLLHYVLILCFQLLVLGVKMVVIKILRTALFAYVQISQQEHSVKI